MSSRIKLGSHTIGTFLDPYIIAEIGVNHGGDMALAKTLIELAHDGGAHAAKFQSYKADLIASKNSPAYWDLSAESTTSQHELFKKYDSFNPEDYVELKEHCDAVGIDFMSTPFDLGAVDYLDDIVPAFKIASADITNVPLLRKVAEKEKPVLLSVGASTVEEIAFAVNTLFSAGCSDPVLLHCVLNYPTPVSHAQLAIIQSMMRKWPKLHIGYSDHVAPAGRMPAMCMAALFGASVLEKHFTHDKSLPGNDHYHAMDKDDLLRFTVELANFRKLYGSSERNLDWEADARLYARRSIVAARDIEEGELLTEENLVVKRPGCGISPTMWDSVINNLATQNIMRDSLIEMGDYNTSGDT
jgi:N-acetylneuraminate synthase